MNFILSTDIFVNGVYYGNSADTKRLGIVNAIMEINKGAKAKFLTDFSTRELSKYLARLKI